MNKTSKLRSRSLKLWFAGLVGVRCLRYLVKHSLPKYPQLRIDQLIVSQRDQCSVPLQNIAKQNKIPCSVILDVDQHNEAQLQKNLQNASKSSADLGLVIGFEHKIPAVAISQCKHGVINLQLAPFPKSHASVTLLMGINQEKEYGVAFHFVDTQLDTGPLIAVSTVPLSQTKTFEQLIQEYEDLAYFFFQEYIDSFLCEEQITIS